MKTKELAEKLKPWIDILADGLRLETFNPQADETAPIHDVDDLMFAVQTYCEIRVKASEHPVGSLKPKGEKLGGVCAKPKPRECSFRGVKFTLNKVLWNHRAEDFINPLKGLKVRRGQWKL